MLAGFAGHCWLGLGLSVIAEGSPPRRGFGDAVKLELQNWSVVGFACAELAGLRLGLYVGLRCFGFCWFDDHCLDCAVLSPVAVSTLRSCPCRDWLARPVASGPMNDSTLPPVPPDASPDASPMHRPMHRPMPGHPHVRRLGIPTSDA